MTPDDIREQFADWVHRRVTDDTPGQAISATHAAVLQGALDALDDIIAGRMSAD